MPWVLEPPPLAVVKDAGALSDVIPLLQRLIDAFGQTPVARLLNVESATIGSWKSRQETPDSEFVKRIIDLHDVLSRAFQIFQPETAMRWLAGHEPFLDNERPADVLTREGAAPVVAALDAIESGAYP